MPFVKFWKFWHLIFQFENKSRCLIVDKTVGKWLSGTFVAWWINKDLGVLCITRTGDLPERRYCQRTVRFVARVIRHSLPPKVVAKNIGPFWSASYIGVRFYGKDIIMHKVPIQTIEKANPGCECNKRTYKNIHVPRPFRDFRFPFLHNVVVYLHYLNISHESSIHQ